MIKAIPYLVSKKSAKDQKKKEKQLILKQKTNYILHFFRDPYTCHRIFRDFILPDYCFTANSPIHYYQNFLFFKSLSQVHVREQGIIIQFHDVNPNFITPKGLLKERLNSMGNKHAHALAEFLDFYYAYYEMQLNPTANQKKKVVFKDWSEIYLGVIKIIDDLFKTFEDDVLIISGYQIHNDVDDRLIMIGFNQEIIQWLVFDEQKINNKSFNIDIIEQLLQVFSYQTYEKYIEDFNDFMTKLSMKTKVELEEDYFERNINTKFGKILGHFKFKNFWFQINDEKFNIVCSVLKKQDQNPWFKMLLENQKKNKDQSIENEKKKKIDGQDWAKLLSAYYPNLVKY